MNEHILQEATLARAEEPPQQWIWRLLPLTIVAGISVTALAARVGLGANAFVSDEALMMLALAAYLVGAAFFLTDLYAPFRFAERVGYLATAAGVTFNLSSWLVRWVAAYERELAIFNAQGSNAADMPWIIRYIPFANLYDLSLAFALGAGVTTLLVIHQRRLSAVAAFSLPLAVLILVLARFIGNEIIDLPPVLDSYWRPIHVGVASLSYGVALVCFAAAVLYLIKDGISAKKISIWTSIFALAVFATISRSSIFAPDSFGTYRASTVLTTTDLSLPLRANIPYVGWLVIAAAGILMLSMGFFGLSWKRESERFSSWGHRTVIAALAIQAVAIAVLVFQLNTLSNVVSRVDSSQFRPFAVWMLGQQKMPPEQIAALGQQQLYDIANKWVTENSSQLQLSLSSNPVELAALITALTGTFFAVLLGLSIERVRASLPAVETLDALMYRLAGITFAGLAVLLMTGAVWANESWGRYWGWDAKEVGALVAWLTYAGFLHSRIAYGWRGRRSAYFAIVAFLFIVFTYLGVSYLLPGLHSYA